MSFRAEGESACGAAWRFASESDTLASGFQHWAYAVKFSALSSVGVALETAIHEPLSSGLLITTTPSSVRSSAPPPITWLAPGHSATATMASSVLSPVVPPLSTKPAPVRVPTETLRARLLEFKPSIMSALRLGTLVVRFTFSDGVPAFDLRVRAVPLELFRDAPRLS
jgi:hypothetical protein